MSSRNAPPPLETILYTVPREHSTEGAQWGLQGRGGALFVSMGLQARSFDFKAGTSLKWHSRLHPRLQEDLVMQQNGYSVGPMKKKRPPQQVTSRVGRLKFHCIIRRSIRLVTPPLLMTHRKQLYIKSFINWYATVAMNQLSKLSSEKPFQREISRHFHDPGTLYGE